MAIRATLYLITVKAHGGIGVIFGVRTFFKGYFSGEQRHHSQKNPSLDKLISEDLSNGARFVVSGVVALEIIETEERSHPGDLDTSEFSDMQHSKSQQFVS